VPLKTVLFDLDGALLPMDQDLFVKTYFKLLAARLAKRGYDPKQLIDGVWAGTAAMVNNDGRASNEAVFWDCFTARFGQQARDDEPEFEAFYREEFQRVKEVCGFAPMAAETVYQLKEKGIDVVLATNPIFPAVATKQRIQWAGLQPEDFVLYTTYENSRFSKPNPAYYQAILDQLDCDPADCLMVGNDVGEDMVVEKLGMQVFLLTDCLICKTEMDLSRYPQGSFPQLQAYIRSQL